MTIQLSDNTFEPVDETRPAAVGASNEDKQWDRALRPQKLDEYVGQSHIRKNLKVMMNAAKKRGEPMDHVLLYGSAGLGKTTLAHIIAKEMGVGIKVTSGPAIERVGDLGSILTNLSDGDVLFIDEIHRLKKIVEEVLYPAMEDGVLDIIVGKGPSARTLQLDLPRFTLVGATTQMGALSAPLRNRFGVSHRLAFYEPEEIEKILHRSAQLLQINISDGAAEMIAVRSRQTPRVANRLLRRCRDWAQAHERVIIDEEVVRGTLELLSIDELGLEDTDRQILQVIIEKFDGGPVGVKTLAAATGEDVHTIEEVYEPFLITKGFVVRTPRGRVATEQAFEHLKIPVPAKYCRMRAQLGM